MAAKISWVGATTPPGLLTRRMTALTAGFSRCSRSSRTALEPSTMIPSISTTATRAPPEAKPSSLTALIRIKTVPMKRTRIPTVTPTAIRATRPRGVTACSARLAYPRRPRSRHRRGASSLPSSAVLGLGLLEDGRGEVLEAEPDAPFIGIDADDHEGQLVAHVDEVGGRRDGPARHLRDVEEAVHSRLQLHEGAEVGESYHLAGKA
jgi:hypothetical protein